MATEIERKYLAKLTPEFRPLKTRVVESAYLSTGSPEVRISRFRGIAGTYKLTTKSSGTLSREEVEFRVDEETGRALFNMVDPATYIVKIRDEQGRWEVDTYLGRHFGLVIAEVELSNPDEVVPLVDGLILIKEVTEYPAFKNKSLAIATLNELIDLPHRYVKEYCNDK